MRPIDADELIRRLRDDPLYPLVENYGIEGVIDAVPTLTEIPKPKKKNGRPLGSRTRKKVSREKIRTLIKQKKINAATLEIRTGYTKDYILHCIYHELMSPDMISGVARCLGVDPAEIEAKA